MLISLVPTPSWGHPSMLTKAQATAALILLSSGPHPPSVCLGLANTGLYWVAMAGSAQPRPWHLG